MRKSQWLADVILRRSRRIRISLRVENSRILRCTQDDTRFELDANF
jgi:hypothetical protein